MYQQKGHIALVNCCLPHPPDKLIGPPQSSLYLASALAQHGLASKIYDTSTAIAPTDFTPEKLYHFLINIPERIIGISLWDSVSPKVILATQKLKADYPDKIIILGGPSASALGDNLVKYFPWIDYVVLGEGEAVLQNLLTWIVSGGHDTLALSGRVVGQDKGRIFCGGSDIPLLERERIPIPDYSLANNGSYNRAEIVTSRGCPYKCSFCSVNNTLSGNIRYRKDEHYWAEIDCLLNDHNYDCVHILDDNFGTDKSRFNRFIHEFAVRHPRKEWSCYFRLSDLGRSTVDLMAESGCCGVFVGIESGSNEKLRAIKKNISDGSIIERIKYAAYKMNVTASFIWGFPDETYDQFLQTLELIDMLLDLENVYVNLYQLAPLSGTKILNEMKGRLIFTEDHISGFIYPPYLAPLTKEEKEIICKYPDIFSAFYHEQSPEFNEKLVALGNFLSQ